MKAYLAALDHPLQAVVLAAREAEGQRGPFVEIVRLRAAHQARVAGPA